MTEDPYQHAADTASAIERDYRDRRRRSRIRNLLAIAGCVALLVAAGSFAYALQQASNARSQLAAEARTVAIAEKSRCLDNAAHNNRQRVLDLALLAADQAVITRLAAVQGHQGLDPDDKLIIGAQLDYYQDAAAARLKDIPPYTDPASCTLIPVIRP